MELSDLFETIAAKDGSVIETLERIWSDKGLTVAKSDLILTMTILVNEFCGLNYPEFVRNEEEFRCLKCDAYFDSYSIFESHLKEHVNEKELSVSVEVMRPRCENCGRTFRTQKSVARHNLLAHDISGRTCPICGKVFESRKSMKKHMDCSHVFRCQFCSRKFPTGSKVVDHIKASHAEEELYKCEICGKKYYFKKSLRCHVFTHTAEASYECETCGKGFRRPSLLAHHRQVHSGLKPWCCELCGMTFTFKKRLNSHIKERHEIGPKTCKHCDKTFMSSFHLKRHVMTVHLSIRPEKPVQCDKCPKRFESRGLLNGHVNKVHNKSIKCEICGYEFGAKTDLKKHMRVHDPNRRHPRLEAKKEYKCDICSKYYVRKSVLELHKRHVHEKRRDFKCDKCGKTFQQNYELTRHMNNPKSHPKLISPEEADISL